MRGLHGSWTCMDGFKTALADNVKKEHKKGLEDLPAVKFLFRKVSDISDYWKTDLGLLPFMPTDNVAESDLPDDIDLSLRLKYLETPGRHPKESNIKQHCR